MGPHAPLEKEHVKNYSYSGFIDQVSHKSTVLASAVVHQVALCFVMCQQQMSMWDYAVVVSTLKEYHPLELLSGS